MLQYVVRIGTEVEARFNSVERLLEYTEVKQTRQESAEGGKRGVTPVVCPWETSVGVALNARRQHVRTFFTLCAVL